MKEVENDIRDELLTKIKQSRPSLSMYDNYYLFKSIIEKSKYEHLMYIRKRLLNTVDNLSSNYKSNYKSLDIYENNVEYIRFKFNSKLVNLGLNILHSIMIEDPVGYDQTFIHRHAGMAYLLKKGYRAEHIIDQMDLREGKTDFFTSIDAQGQEVKFLEAGIRLCFTLPQFINFNDNDNIVMFKRIRDSLYRQITNIGYIYIGTIKFRDILNNKYLYKIEIKDSDFNTAIRERQRVLTNRRRQTTIDDAW